MIGKMQKKELRINKKVIGDNRPCFIIAEAGANFRVSDNPAINFKHALKLIDIAVDAKADAVKFQLYRAEKLYVENAGEADYIGNKRSIYQIIKEMELPYRWLPKLKDYCDKKGIIFLCSPFDEESVDQLERINILAYKVASYSINNIPLLKYIAKKGKPIILSTGASNLKDIEKAIKTINDEENKQIALMQCTAKYPAPLSTINLRTIPFLTKKFKLNIGLSDHSREPLIAPLGAVALGAKIIEKHFTTDNNLPGPDHNFAILPKELKCMVSSIKKIELAMGSLKKEIQNVEKDLYNFARGYIYTIKEIKKGDIISEENIAVLRSGKLKKGLDPEYFDRLIGKKSLHNLNKNYPIHQNDVSKR